MAETLVKEKVCNSCGAEVRANAVFCYNCGSAVAPGVPIAGNNTRKLSNDWFQGDLAEKEKIETVSEKNEDVIIENQESPDAEIISESPDAAETIEESEVEKRDLSKMDSAANLRRRGKSLQKKRVEIVWEEHDNAPNGWFIFFAILLTGLAVGIWYVSVYLQ